MSSTQNLTLLLERLRAKNAVQDTGNLSNVWWDTLCDRFGSQFYEDMATYCDVLIPRPDYPTLQPEGMAFTDACKRTDKSWKWRTEEAVQDVLEKWTKLQPKVMTYFEILENDHSGYAIKQYHVTDRLLYYMAKFVKHYDNNKNVWAFKVKRST